jgi:hypothetical protein
MTLGNALPRDATSRDALHNLFKPPKTENNTTSIPTPDRRDTNLAGEQHSPDVAAEEAAEDAEAALAAVAVQTTTAVTTAATPARSTEQSRSLRNQVV